MPDALLPWPSGLHRAIHLERVLPWPRDLVWRAIAEPRALGAWFMRTDFEPVPGRHFRFEMLPQRGWDGITLCEVLEVTPGQSVAMAYRGRASGEKALDCAGIDSPAADAALGGIFTDLDTVLRFTVSDEPGAPGRTRLVLHHSGFVGLKAWIISFIMGAGWGRVMLRLPPVLEALARGETPPLRP